MFARFARKCAPPGAQTTGPRENRKPGDLFKQVTGKSVDQCATIDDIDAAVAQAHHVKGRLPFTHSGSNFVIRNGDVFPHAEIGETEQVDKLIDAALDKA